MNHNKRVVIVGTVMHVQPQNLHFLEELLQNSPYVERLILFKESNNKLWIVERS